MKYVIALFFGICAPFFGYSQCTLSGTGTINWNNASPPACQEGGNAGGATVIIIPSGVTLNFDSNADTWTGVRIEVNGTLNISAPGSVTINANIEVKNGGLLRIDSKLSIGSSSGCGYTLIIQSGGTADIISGSSDRLNICGNEIARGGSGGCNDYPAGPPSYCEPSGGFTGPTGFDETGVDSTLPITLLYFDVSLNPNGSVKADWATATEKNVRHFVLERSGNGLDFEEIEKVEAAGESLSRKEYSAEDIDPLVGRNYYRLKEVDLNGDIEHFHVRLLNVGGQKKVSVYPNPFVNAEAALVRFNFSNDEKSYGRIIDLSGKEIHQFSFTGQEGAVSAKLQKGTYLITVTTGAGMFITKLIVP